MFYILKRIWSRRPIEFLSRKLTISLTLSVFTLHSNIVNSLLELSDCELIYEETYLRSYLIENCESERYKNWFYYFVLPNFMIYGFFIPLFAFIFLLKNRSLVLDKDIIEKIGFLVNGYKTKKYYWEFIYFIRKMIIAFLTSYLSASVAVKTVLILIILVISSIFQMKNAPFMTKKLNDLELNEVFTCLILLLSGYLSHISEDAFTQTICIFIIILSNSFFLLQAVKRFTIFKMDSLIGATKIVFFNRKSISKIYYSFKFNFRCIIYILLI